MNTGCYDVKFRWSIRLIIPSFHWNKIMQSSNTRTCPFFDARSKQSCQPMKKWKKNWAPECIWIGEHTNSQRLDWVNVLSAQRAEFDSMNSITLSLSSLWQIPLGLQTRFQAKHSCENQAQFDLWEFRVSWKWLRPTYCIVLSFVTTVVGSCQNM